MSESIPVCCSVAFQNGSCSYKFEFMLIDKQLIDELTERAEVNPWLRMNYDLRDSSEDESQRMLNAIEPGTVIPIHRHSMKSEDVAILRGRAVCEGKIAARI